MNNIVNFFTSVNGILVIIFIILIIAFLISTFNDKKRAKQAYDLANKENLVYLLIDENTKIYSINSLIPYKAVDFNKELINKKDFKNISKIYAFEYTNMAKIVYSIGSKVRPLKKTFQTDKLTTVISTKPGHVYKLMADLSKETVKIKLEDITRK